jgi:hypothetical protein
LICKKKKKRKKEERVLLISVGLFFVTLSFIASCHETDSMVLKKSRHFFSALSSSPAALAVAMSSSLTSSGPVLVLRCPVLFNDTNYHD